jgi:hypothetical protein
LYLTENLPGVPGERRNWIAAGATVFIVGFDSFWGNLRWGFHENITAFVGLSWALALIFSSPATTPDRQNLTLKRVGGVLLLLLASAASKEILLLDVAFVFLIWGVLERRPGARGVTPLLSLLAFIFLVSVFIWFEKLPHPADKNYFARYYAYLGLNLKDFSSSILLAPERIIQSIGIRALLKYGLITVALPWLFLPFFAPKRRLLWLLAPLPSFASAALSTFAPLRSPSFHYVLELWPFMGALTILALARLSRYQTLAVAWAFLSLLLLDHDPVGEIREYWSTVALQKDARAAITAIDPKESIAADELAGPWVANRRMVTTLPDLTRFEGKCPDWLLLTDSNDHAPPADIGAVITDLKHRCGVSAPSPAWHHGTWTAYRLGR